MKKLLAQRKPYQTPEEIFKMLQASQNLASSGLDPTTLGYLTTQTDRAFSGGLATAERLGADPNDLSSLFDAKMNQVMKVGSENHSENMKNFSVYLGALNTLGENKAAEQKSQQDILKDQIQAKAGQIQQDNANVGNAVNSAIGTLASAETNKLYKDRTDAIAKGATKVNLGTGRSNFTPTQWSEMSSILNYSGNNNWASQALPVNDK